jgi:hypothetical protein
MDYATPDRHDAKQNPPVYQTLKALYREEELRSVPMDAIRSYGTDNDHVSGFFEADLRQRLEQQEEGGDATEHAVERGLIRSEAWDHPAIDIHVVPSETGDDETWLYSLDEDTVDT